jgi:hypothetical protein
MYTPQPSQRSCVPGMMFIMLLAFLLLASPVFGQQTYVTQFDAFTGYNFLNSAKLGLSEPGFGAQFGFRPKTWYSFGFDFTASSGDMSLSPSLLPTSLQQPLGAIVGQFQAIGLLPASYALAVPAHSKTETFAVGPQLAYRHFKHVTLFLRPVFAGAIHETATPTPPADLLAALGHLPPATQAAVMAAVPKALAPLMSGAEKTDTTWFLGFGGGFDILLTNHFAIRTQADYVYDHLFNDILADGRFTTRFSIGPAFNFGKNIAVPPR